MTRQMELFWPYPTSPGTEKNTILKLTIHCQWLNPLCPKSGNHYSKLWNPGDAVAGTSEHTAKVRKSDGNLETWNLQLASEVSGSLIELVPMTCDSCPCIVGHPVSNKNLKNCLLPDIGGKEPTPPTTPHPLSFSKHVKLSSPTTVQLTNHKIFNHSASQRPTRVHAVSY